jgi:hypothetical protein
MEYLQTLEETRAKIRPIDYHTLTTEEQYSLGAWHLGNFKDLDNIDKDSEEYKSFKYVFEEISPPTKVIKWGDMLELRKSKKWMTFMGASIESVHYHKFLPHLYTCKERPGKNPGMMDCAKTINGEPEFAQIKDYVEFHPDTQITDHTETSLNSMYYHSAKAHWLVQSIQEEGLRHPIQGMVFRAGDRYGFRIHPGSIRSKVYEELEDPNFEVFTTDAFDILPGEPLTCDEAIQYWNDKCTARGVPTGLKNMTVTFVNGTIEYQHQLMDLNFRQEVYDFNKRVHLQSKGKPINIYIGYDSNHGDLHEVNKKSLLKKLNIGNGHLMNECRWEPEIKFLDIAKLPDYNREYANQSTEFTYSRFLIPHLENYEGFSIFIDNDFIWRKPILPLFYYLNMDDAVACIKYPQIKHDEQKFNGEVNIDYPCKLWSSLMVFNNGHEDCKKLTPEVVNTWTGAQLHQFEWTDKISPIPEKYIFTEGYDNPDEKWDYTGIHYTRGGPWIKGMDYSHINNLDDWVKAKTY